jgi:hypothetical protein
MKPNYSSLGQLERNEYVTGRRLGASYQRALPRAGKTRCIMFRFKSKASAALLLVMIAAPAYPENAKERLEEASAVLN